MNEATKSIWKKTLAGNWLGSLLLALAGATVIVIIGAFAGLFPAEMVDWIAFVLVLWPLIAFIRWLCCWRHFKKFAFVVLCLVTLVALIGAEETWRGKRALEKFKSDWSARGEKFDFQSFVPPVPDEQNFALTPVVASSYEMLFDKHGHEINPRNTNVVDRLTMLGWRDNQWAKQPKSDSWSAAKKTDLKAWQDFFRATPPADSKQTNSFPMTPQPQAPAADVLLALTKYDSALAELRSAVLLPASRFPLTYDKDNPGMILLPHLSALKSCAQTLALRSAAELELGQSDAALADVRLELKLADSIRTEPTLISQLVRLAILQISLQPIYEGLAGKKWSDAQLKMLEAELARLDLLADYQYAMRGERIFNMAGVDYVRRERDPGIMSDFQNGATSSRTPKPLVWLSRLIMPDGFFYQNELTMARLHQQYTLPMVDVTNGLVSPGKIHAQQKAASAELEHWFPYKLFARMLFPALEKSVEKFTKGQISVNLARTAIALERCRLASGNFPESLDALAPSFIEKIPHDVIGGGPLKYRREADGRFTLYSVGWNETDDGGVVVFSKGESPSVDFKQGDWVWAYPKSQP